jgi:hypothetical protein
VELADDLLNADKGHDMTVMTGPTSVCTPKHRASAGRARSYLIFALCASLYILPFMRLLMLGTDEGTLDYGAVRVLHGQVFTRDFFEVI